MGMIYLSAQPSEPYFVWQLEIQLQNFRETGIPPEDIHVILGYKADEGIPNLFLHLEETNTGTFFYYPDTREHSKYTSSIRPHLLRKHFEAFPELVDRVIFYHDSDIIFRERIDEEKFLKDDIWYLSDTRNYLSAHYLKAFGKDLFIGLCDIVGISPTLVEDNIRNTGGAQHIMKQIDASYWYQVECDSERIFNFLNEYNKHQQEGKKVQAWCADMWAVLWNAWKKGVETKIDSELDFCWPKDHISRWYATKILHNAGVFQKDKESYFCKLLYKTSNPYYVDYSYLKGNTCSTIFVDHINRSFHLQNKNKRILKDLTVIMVVENCDISVQKKIDLSLRYLSKHFVVDTLVLEKGDIPRVNHKAIKDYARYFHIGNESISKYIRRKVCTTYLLVQDASILIPVGNIIEGYDKLLQNKKIFIQPYNELKTFDSNTWARFTDSLEVVGENKSLKVPHIDHSECFLLSKRDYLSSGGENLKWKYFANSGINLERELRMRFLEFKIHRVTKPAFKLFEVNLEERYIQNNISQYVSLAEKGCKEYIRKQITCGLYSEQRYFYNKTDHNSHRIPYPISCINLEKRKDRKQHVCHEFKNRPEFLLYFTKAIEHKNGNIGLWESIVSIIKKHDFSEYKYLYICEDDILFTSQYSAQKLESIIQEMDKFNLELVIGGSTGGFSETRKLSSNLIWVDRFYSNHFLIVSESLAQRILKLEYRGEKPVDHILSDLTEFKAICVPFLAIQKNFNYSDITLQNQNYPDDVGKRFARAEQHLTYLLRHENES